MDFVNWHCVGKIQGEASGSRSARRLELIAPSSPAFNSPRWGVTEEEEAWFDVKPFWPPNSTFAGVGEGFRGAGQQVGQLELVVRLVRCGLTVD